MEAGAPYYPPVGSAMLIFRQSGDSGYFGKPSGPTWKCIHRNWDDIVPVAEIENSLQHLGIEGVELAHFWEIQDHENKGARHSESEKRDYKPEEGKG